MELKPGEKNEILGVMKDLAGRRREKQPLEFPSAGSTFKRPEGYFAGALIEEAGLKGFRIGDAQVSEKHAGFVINCGEATCEQVLELVTEVKNRVFENSGVVLEEEIKVNVVTAMINRNKVPYTDAGIAIIEAAIRQALARGQATGGIAPTEYDENGNENLGYTVTVPLAATISPNQKASRILEDVEFTARLAGAIHVVEIDGSLTYENLIVGGE
jgi:hypothetical protein